MDDPTEFLLRLQSKMDKSLSLAESAWRMAQATEKRTTELHATMRDLLAEAAKPAVVMPQPGSYRPGWRPCWGWGAMGMLGGILVGVGGVVLRLWAATPLSVFEVLKVLFGA